jgi:glycosyltransferase involved in cell wall biosynthesis
MRICLYTSTAHPKLGGQEAVVDALARHFLRLGHQPTVLAPMPRRPTRPRDVELPYLVARHPRLVSTRHFVSFYRRWLIDLHARERFDIIHCHDVYPTGYLAALAKPRMRVPVVITSHGGDVKENNVRIVKAGMRARFIRGVESADALVSIGRFTEEGYRKLSDKLPPIVSIPNGIDLEPYQTRAARPSRFDAAIESGKYLLFLGRLAKRKGVDVLIDAVAQLEVGNRVQCVIAGSGDEQAALQARAVQQGVAERVRFVGRVEGEEKIWLLQNALAVAMPSRVWEAFPLVLIEAFAAGKPVVGSAVPGIADLVQEGQTGMLVREESADALAAALRVLLNDLARAKHMGQQARTFAQQYAWDAVAARHLALYQQLLTRSPASSAT